MNIKIIIKNLVFSFILLFIISLSNIGYSAENFQTFNNAPRMKIEVNEKNFDDVKITFTDYSGLDTSNIIFYTVKNGIKDTQITDNTFIKKIDTVYNQNNNTPQKYIYTISNTYLNNKSNSFYVTVSDKNNSACSLKTFFRIKAKDNKYVADYAPRVFDWKYSNNKVSFSVKDLTGIDYIKLYDMNSDTPANEVLTYSNLAKGESVISFELEKFKQIDGKYKIKISAQDNNKTYKQSAIRVVEFSAHEFKTINTTENDINYSNVETQNNLNQEFITSSTIQDHTALSGTNKYVFINNTLYRYTFFGIKYRYSGMYNGKYYKNGLKYTGNYNGYYYRNGLKYTGNYNGYFYERGKRYTGSYYGIYYYNGRKYTGIHRGVYYRNGRKYNGYYYGYLYKNGVKFTGTAYGYRYDHGKKYTGKYNGKYYINGKAYTGTRNGVYYKNGSKYTGNYKGYYYKNGVKFTGTTNGYRYDHGKKYTGMYSGKYYKNGKTYTGIYKGYYYKNGSKSTGTYNGYYYRNGIKYTGNYNNCYYKNGKKYTGFLGSLYYRNGKKYSKIKSQMMFDALLFATKPNYIIVIYNSSYQMGVLKKNSSTGQYDFVQYTRISIGRVGKTMSSGNYRICHKEKSFSINKPNINIVGRFWYCSGMKNSDGNHENYIHSTAYDINDKSGPHKEVDGTLGKKITNGCTRVPLGVAKYIYMNCGEGTPVLIRNK